MIGDSTGFGRSNTSKSSSESITSSTRIVSSPCSESEEITSFSTVHWSGSSTGLVPSGGGLAMNSGTTTSIRCNQGSLALMTFLGDWKL